MQTRKTTRKTIAPRTIGENNRIGGLRILLTVSVTTKTRPPSYNES